MNETNENKSNVNARQVQDNLAEHKDLSDAEILALLRKLTGRDIPANVLLCEKQHDPDDTDPELDEEENEFEGDFYWNPSEEWKTAGCVLGGAALVGVGVLIGRLLSK